MPKITTGKAVEKAMQLVTHQLAGKLDGKHTPYNCGDDHDFVYDNEEAALKSAWEKKRFTHAGLEYKGKLSVSSGQPKFDLRLVHGTENAVFNYHVPFQKDTRAEEAAKAQAAADKKIAAATKAALAEKQAAEAKKKAAEAAAAKAAEAQKKKRDQAMATAWNQLKTKPKDKAAWAKDWLEKNKSRKF